jgi:hypothetical protein
MSNLWAIDGWTLFDRVDSGLFERLFKKDTLEAEEKFMLAVLESATEYFQKYLFAEDERGKKLFQEAEEWILDKDSDRLYSFENICEVLKLHPDYMRQWLRCWKEARRNGRSIQTHHVGRAKLVKTRVVHTSVGRRRQGARRQHD